MRINKYIAGSGVTSRRGADKLVEEGRVKVNNKTVTTLGFEVNEDNDTVTVDGRKITLVNKYTYLMLYKPKGCSFSQTTARLHNISRTRATKFRSHIL